MKIARRYQTSGHVLAQYDETCCTGQPGRISKTSSSSFAGPDETQWEERSPDIADLDERPPQIEEYTFLTIRRTELAKNACTQD